MVLLDNREVKQGWEPLKETVAGMFSKHGAELLSARRWDERRLAYPIRGQIRGTYLLLYYKGEPTQNPGIRRELDLSETVLRHMTSVCEEVPGEAFEPEAEFDLESIPAADETAPAESSAGEADDEAKATTEKATTEKAPTEKAPTDEATTDETTGEAATGEADAGGEAAASSTEDAGETTAAATEKQE